jgi:hypothetical protein
MISIVSGTTFIAVLLGLVLIPRQATHTARTVTTQIRPRSDSTALVARRARAQEQLAAADSALAAARKVTAAEFAS